MGIISAAVKALITAGVSNEAIISAIAEMEAGGTVKAPDGKEFAKRKAYVYVIGGSWDQPVKIGFSKNPWARIESLQSASPMKLSVLCSFRTDTYSEFEIHRVLDAYRVSGEWFALPADVVAVFVRSFEMGSNYHELLSATREVAATVADVAPTVATTSPPLARGETNLTKVVDLSIERKEREVAQALPPPPKPVSQKRGTRIVEGWRPSEAGIAFARTQGLPEANIEREIIKMVNHFSAKAGQAGVKLNWDATWQNWVLKACEYGGFAPPAPVAPKVNDDNYRPYPGAPSSAEIKAAMKAREQANGGQLSEHQKPETTGVLRAGSELHTERGRERVSGRTRDAGMEPLGGVLSRLGVRALPNENGPLETTSEHDNAGSMARVVRHSMGG